MYLLQIHHSLECRSRAETPEPARFRTKHLPRLWLSRRLLELLRDEDKDEDDRVPPTRLESEGPPTQPASQTAKQ